ncbi:hypothetical protein [Halomonas sp.]|uniref:hypothetical protein n=1 Tax=Halomonas sp. TaxID=1486246 RepID=UPI0035624DC0
MLSILFGAFQIYGYLSRSESVPFTKVITLTFEGADEGKYPSGAPYRIQDIIAPAVLRSVYADLNIEDQGLSAADFQSRISVEPYTPYYRAIIAKYEALLDPKNQNYEQIKALQERKRRELSAALSSAALITFDPAGSDLSAATVDEVVTQVPERWARQAIVDKGVLKTDVQLTSARTLEQSLFANVDYVVLSDIFAEKTEALKQNIDKINQLAGAATVRDPETGWTLSDLRSNLHDLKNYRIDKLMSPIRSLGLSRTPRLAILYFEEKREVLQDKQTQLQEESDLIQAAYESYSADPNLRSPAGEGGPGTAPAYPGMMPQLGGEMLDKLLKVAGEDSAEEYRQLLNNRWLAANLEVAEVKGEVRNIDRIIEAVAGSQKDAPTVELRDEYLQRAEAGFPEIVSRLRDFYDINWRIYEQISRERVGSVGYLYKDGHQGVLRASAMPNLTRTLLVYIALMAAMTFVLVPAVMTRNAMKERSE